MRLFKQNYLKMYVKNICMALFFCCLYAMNTPVKSSNLIADEAQFLNHCLYEAVSGRAAYSNDAAKEKGVEYNSKVAGVLDEIYSNPSTFQNDLNLINGKNYGPGKYHDVLLVDTLTLFEKIIQSEHQILFDVIYSYIDKQIIGKMPLKTQFYLLLNTLVLDKNEADKYQDKAITAYVIKTIENDLDAKLKKDNHVFNSNTVNSVVCSAFSEICQNTKENRNLFFLCIENTGKFEYFNLSDMAIKQGLKILQSSNRSGDYNEYKEALERLIEQMFYD